MSIDTSSSIIKSFKNFFIGTFFSRITGFLRDVCMAFFFGASPYIAAFMVAYRFANLFRRLIGESSFQASFIPHYEAIRVQDKKNAAIFYRDLFFSLICLLLLLILISEIILFCILPFIENKEIIKLTQIMIFGLFFISLYALNSSFLQCHKKFFLPSVAPAMFNIIWIGTIIFYKNLEDYRFVYVLSIAVVIAFLFQYLMTVFSSFKILTKEMSLKDWLGFRIFTSDIKKLVKPVTLSIIGIGAVQINSAIDAVFATIASSRGPAYLWYAIRLNQLPLSLIGIALSSAILPSLSRAYRNNDLINFKKFLNLALRKAFSLMLIAAFALIVMGASIVNLIYKRGAFNLEDLINTNRCLLAYSTGLGFMSFVMIISTAFYAKKEYFLPMKASVYSVILNILLNFIFVFLLDLKAVSIALATSISAFFNFLILSFYLKNKFENIFEEGLMGSFIKTGFCCFLAAIITIAIGSFLNDQSILLILNRSFILPNQLIYKINSFFILSTVYLGSLAFLAFILKADQILDFIRKPVSEK